MIDAEGSPVGARPRGPRVCSLRLAFALGGTAALIALLLTACSGGSSSEKPPPSSQGAVQNARWKSGVPLGGMGVGKVELLTDGSLGNVTINHNWDRPIGHLKDAFFALATQGADGFRAFLLRLDSPDEYEGASNIQSVGYTGLFPRAWVDYSDKSLGLDAGLFAFSPLVPHDAHDSSLPVAAFRLTLVNADPAPVTARVAFSWPNLLGIGGRTDVEWSLTDGNGQEPWSGGGLAGLLYRGEAGLAGAQRNVEGSYLVTVDSAELDRVWTVEEWPSAGSEIPWWAAFRDGGLPASEPVAAGETRAGVVGGDLTIPAGESRSVDFTLVWFMPNHVVLYGEEGARELIEDLGHFYLRSFSSPGEIARYVQGSRDRLLDETAAWQDPVLGSNLPEWLQRLMVNSAFPTVSNTILTRDGRFTALESPVDMKGALGTMDQRLAGHAFLSQLFSELDGDELEMFAAAQRPNGQIPHFIGNVNLAVGNPVVPYGITDWPDLACSWVGQVVKLWRWTGDDGFARRMWPSVMAAMEWLAEADRDGDGIPEGGSTFDYQTLPRGAFIYTATVYLGALRLAAELADDLGEPDRARAYRSQFEGTRASVMGNLWNGEYFIKWASPQSGRNIPTSFVAGMAGDWLARLAGAPALFSPSVTESALENLIARHMKPFSVVPPMEVDANGRQMISKAFFLQQQPYLGCEAIYANFVDDGLDLFRRTYQAVWEINADPWSEALSYISPGGAEEGLDSYISAPTTWHVLNALSGVTLDLARGVLYCSPRFGETLPELHIPVYLPRTWLWLDAVPGRREITLSVLRSFGEAPAPSVRRIARDGDDPGFSLPEPWVMRQGATLDLGAHWDELAIGPGRQVTWSGPRP